MIKLLAKIANLFVTNRPIEVARVDQPLPVWRMVSGDFDLNDADLVLLSSGCISKVLGEGENKCFYSPIIGTNRAAYVVAYRRRGVKKSRVISRKTILENRK